LFGNREFDLFYSKHDHTHVTHPTGAISLPLLLITLIIAMCGLGILGFQVRWRQLVQSQLCLDRCVGQAAHHLRDLLNQLSDENQTILRLRIAIQAASKTPYLIPALKTSLLAVTIQQDLQLQAWQMRRAQWWMERPCGIKKNHRELNQNNFQKDKITPLPDLNFQREPADSIGPQPLLWKDPPQPTYFRIYRALRPRAAVAYVVGPVHWQASWSMDRPAEP
jgi:hypothetical protein